MSAPVTPFTQVIDVTDITRRQRSLRRRLLAIRLTALILLMAAAIIVGYPLALQYESDKRLEAQNQQIAQEVAGWPYPQAENALAAAREYNQRLAASGQPILGERVDPFASQSGATSANSQDTGSASDQEYQSLLDADGLGTMGAIRIPEISVDLPIRHGTSDSTLAEGAGHLYGTSLPVGGTSTHTVITGHRGLVEALMFTRIDELREGDFMYLDVMGETLAYQVDHIWVIDPDDTSRLRITKGEDRLTLLTCTPYGVNTQRLLVSGHRVTIPDPAPNPTDLHDGRTIAIWTTVGTLAVGTIAITIINRRRARMARRMRHSTRTTTENRP